MPRCHALKTWSDDFEAVAAGTKTHEARLNDRGFAVGDTLQLQEWMSNRETDCGWASPGVTGRYSGRYLEVLVTHVTQGQYGLPADLCVMSIRITAPVATSMFGARTG